MIKYRAHRGGLSDSMKTYRQFDNIADLLDYLSVEECDYWKRDISKFSFSKSYGADMRIGWSNWRYVLYNGRVVGMCDFCEEEELFSLDWIKHDYAEEDHGYCIPNYECPYCHSWRRENTTYCPDCGRRVLYD